MSSKLYIMTLHTQSQDKRGVFTVPTNRPFRFLDRNNLGRSRVVASSTDRCLKENDPFLYFSKSRQRLDELRFSFGGFSEVENSTERSFDGDNERKTRFSTEVHATHAAMIAGLEDDVHVLGDINDMLDKLDSVSI